MELEPVKKVQNLQSMHLNMEHMSARNEGVFRQLLLKSSASLWHRPVAVTKTPTAIEYELKKKYPNIIYNVYDMGRVYSQTLMFKPDLERSGAAAFDDCDCQIKPGSKAVAIHPEAARKMERDPVFADDVLQRIYLWFDFDTARNEAIEPGSANGMSQGVTIGSDGSVANVVSIPAPDDKSAVHEKWYTALWNAQQMANNSAASMRNAALNTANSAAAQLAMMLNSGELQSVFGSAIAGVPVDDMVRETKKKVWGIEA